MLNLEKCYRILDVNDNSTPKEIKHAYRKLSLKYHPDRSAEQAHSDFWKY